MNYAKIAKLIVSFEYYALLEGGWALYKPQSTKIIVKKASKEELIKYVLTEYL